MDRFNKYLAVNPVEGTAKVEENKVIIISKDNKEINLEKMSKEKVARNLFDIILKKR